MKIIAGLGNPGSKYRRTRHNLGFEVVDGVAAHLNVAIDRDKHKGLWTPATHQGEKLMLVKPQTYMNLSGECIAALARNKVFDPEDVLVVVDDVNLPLGKLRFRAGGSAGGHNGLKSVIERLGTKEFHRLRLGVGDERQGPGLADHVLSKFRPEERKGVQELTERAITAALCWAVHGIERAMNACNG
jgi:peptidyl-tRNA hydrolase, PTH1 family